MKYYKTHGFVDGKVRYVIVDGQGKTINKYPTKEELKLVVKWNFKYNDTETCDICRENGIETKLGAKKKEAK